MADASLIELIDVFSNQINELSKEVKQTKAIRKLSQNHYVLESNELSNDEKTIKSPILDDNDFTMAKISKKHNKRLSINNIFNSYCSLENSFDFHGEVYEKATNDVEKLKYNYAEIIYIKEPDDVHSSSTEKYFSCQRNNKYFFSEERYLLYREPKLVFINSFVDVLTTVNRNSEDYQVDHSEKAWNSCNRHILISQNYYVKVNIIEKIIVSYACNIQIQTLFESLIFFTSDHLKILFNLCNSSLLDNMQYLLNFDNKHRNIIYYYSCKSQRKLSVNGIYKYSLTSYLKDKVSDTIMKNKIGNTKSIYCNEAKPVQNISHFSNLYIKHLSSNSLGLKNSRSHRNKEQVIQPTFPKIENSTLNAKQNYLNFIFLKKIVKKIIQHIEESIVGVNIDYVMENTVTGKFNEMKISLSSSSNEDRAFIAAYTKNYVKDCNFDPCKSAPSTKVHSSKTKSNCEKNSYFEKNKMDAKKWNDPLLNKRKRYRSISKSSSIENKLSSNFKKCDYKNTNNSQDPFNALNEKINRFMMNYNSKILKEYPSKHLRYHQKQSKVNNTKTQDNIEPNNIKNNNCSVTISRFSQNMDNIIKTTQSQMVDQCFTPEPTSSLDDSGMYSVSYDRECTSLIYPANSSNMGIISSKLRNKRKRLQECYQQNCIGKSPVEHKNIQKLKESVLKCQYFNILK